MNNEVQIIDDTWIGKKVTCEIERDGEWLNVEDGEIAKVNGNFYILQNVANGAGQSNNPHYQHSWGVSFNVNLDPVHADTRNLKLVEEEEPEEEFPVGFRFNSGANTYEITSCVNDNSVVVTAVDGNFSTSISLESVRSNYKRYPQNNVQEHNAKLFKPKQVFKFNDIIKNTNNKFYVVASETVNINKEYVVYDISNKQYINLNTRGFTLSSLEEARQTSPTHAKVISVDDSIRILEYKERKLPCLGKTLEFKQFRNGWTTKYGPKSCVELVYPGGTMGIGRWLLSDIELVLELPVITIQKHRRDLTVKVKDSVRLVNNKKLPIERNAICEVTNIVETTNKKYLIKNTRNRPLDVVYLKCPKTGRVLPTYMKNVKKVNNETR